MSAAPRIEFGRSMGTDGCRSSSCSRTEGCSVRRRSQATPTDVHVLLGRLPPHLLGGEITLDSERARFGLQRLADRLDMDLLRLAAGVLEIADWNQVNAIRQVTVKKGLDPRDYAMVAF